MRVKNHFFSTALIMCSIITARVAIATPFPVANRPFSKDGLIQNVQNYSSNPFWTPDSLYNQRMPQPVYVQGTDLDTGDCQRVVSALVASYCGARNNCRAESLSDAKPTLTIQLASLPNHNYVSACGGYIDAEFQSYVSRYANAAPTNGPVAFPAATTANPAVNQPEFKIKNPYEVQIPTWNGDPWMQEMIERKMELDNLQSQNGAGNEKIVKADFPTTVADLSFTQRMENAAAGYAPYKGKSAYQQIKIESPEEYQQRYQSRQDAFCANALAQLNVLNSDLAALQKCRQSGIRFADCKTQGQYN